MPHRLPRAIWVFLLSLPILLIQLKGREFPGAVGISYRVSEPAVPPGIEENRFTKNILIEKMDEPLQLAVLDSKRILYIERKGKLWLFDESTRMKTLVATIPVSTKYTDAEGRVSEAEDGLLGLATDPGFKQNGFIYLYYSPAGTVPKNILTRYVYKNGRFDLSSRKILLEVPVQRQQCCHTGGGIAFDEDGNLFLSTGDNTSPRATPYSPIDEREGRSPWDAQKSSANTNDFRGKILRIKPNEDGTYSVPEGNLFAKGTPGTKPEIYTMGLRNPYRISIDGKRGILYWGDVGPDSGNDSTGLGPRSFDELNQAKNPGFYGWPYFVGDNQAYWKFDFSTNQSGEKFDPEKPLNLSPNNTGMKELPPAQKPMVWYAYDQAKEFPLLGTGGRSAMAGPVFYSDDFKNAKRRYPDYFNGKLFFYDWMRDWIMLISFDDQGNYKSMERFLPGMPFSHPIHMQFGPDGDLYILEYGTGWFQGNDDARLVKLEYNGGNRKPVVEAGADKLAGALPLLVQFNANGTMDPDKDSLSYEWRISTASGTLLKTFNEKEPQFSFSKPGNYKVNLSVTDIHGEKASAALLIKAGNEPPDVNITITGGNKRYYFPGETFQYKVQVSDKEDGSLGKGISSGQVKIDIRYLDDSTLAKKSGSPKEAGASTTFAEGQRLISLSDCKSCHAPEKKVIGPSYKSIAQKYAGQSKAPALLSGKIINGGSGVWGDVPMAAHPQLSKKDVEEMVKYILSFAGTSSKPASLPLEGSFQPKLPDSTGDKSVVLITARYTDKGAPGASPVTTVKQLMLQNPRLVPASGWKMQGVQKFKLPDPPMEMFIVMNKDTWVAYQQVDLSGIHQVRFSVMAPKEQLNSFGGRIEVRLDSPDGELIGESAQIEVLEGPITGASPVDVVATIKEVPGEHNIYLVFRNPEAKGPLFIVFSATLEKK